MGKGSTPPQPSCRVTLHSAPSKPGELRSAMSTQQENRYRADLRDIMFVLLEQHRVGELLGEPPRGGWGGEEVRDVVSAAYKIFCYVLGQINYRGNLEV